MKAPMPLYDRDSSPEYSTKKIYNYCLEKVMLSYTSFFFENYKEFVKRFPNEKGFEQFLYRISMNYLKNDYKDN